MDKKSFRAVWSMAFVLLLMVNVIWSEVQAGSKAENFQKELVEKSNHELWMGIYMEGVKVGYSHIKHSIFSQNGKEHRKTSSQSGMRISRLGGSAVEIKTAHESHYDAEHRLVETLMRIKMSESETVIRAEVRPKKILFKFGNEIIKELAYEGDLFLEVPLGKIIEEEGLKPGRKYVFQVLDPFSYSLSDSRFEVVGEEEVLILGKKMKLWRVKTETDYLIPLVADEWIDEQGNIWRSESQTSFLTTTSIRMTKEKALETSEENFDIAFSTIIKSNLSLESPRIVKTATFKLSGIPSEKIEHLPFDDGSQEILELKINQALIKTTSQIFNEADSVVFPVEDTSIQEYLKPSSFCQSEDPEIRELAREIVGDERNVWRAAKRIAEWVSQEMTANYDVGFATAKEIIKNRAGDCSEHTVINVALCRAAGIPARAALGIMYGQGLFAYHMWPEVFVGRWIGLDAKWLATDEESGEYYTDATHIKFGRSNLDENIFKEMAQAISEILGKLNIEVIDYYHKK